MQELENKVYAHSPDDRLFSLPYSAQGPLLTEPLKRM
jgi:hypothetical protein